MRCYKIPPNLYCTKSTRNSGVRTALAKSFLIASADLLSWNLNTAPIWQTKRFKPQQHNPTSITNETHITSPRNLLRLCFPLVGASSRIRTSSTDRRLDGLCKNLASGHEQLVCLDVPTNWFCCRQQCPWYRPPQSAPLSPDNPSSQPRTCNSNLIVAWDVRRIFL